MTFINLLHIYTNGNGCMNIFACIASTITAFVVFPADEDASLLLLPNIVYLILHNIVQPENKYSYKLFLEDDTSGLVNPKKPRSIILNYTYK